MNKTSKKGSILPGCLIAILVPMAVILLGAFLGKIFDKPPQFKEIKQVYNVRDSSDTINKKTLVPVKKDPYENAFDELESQREHE